MTGFGKFVCELPLKNITIEIKSVNSKQLDCNIKLPYLYREKEIELRNLLSTQLERGKIDVYVNVENTGEILNYSINKPIVAAYFKELKSISDELNITDFKDYLPIILKLPEVLKTENNEISEEEWKLFRSVFEKAINKVNEFRLNEGAIIEKDMLKRISIIDKFNESLDTLDKERVNYIRKRIEKNLNEVIEENKFDKNRLEQEIIYYLEKLDFTEERVRLKKHCNYFVETIKSPDSNGKKLGFITQELGREINTLGSKANDADIQKIIVLMKDELEKIKEQLMNIL